MSCKCLEQFDEALKPHGIKIGTAFQYTKEGDLVLVLPLVVERLPTNKHGKLPLVICSYCPFCGTKWDALTSVGDTAPVVSR